MTHGRCNIGDLMLDSGQTIRDVEIAYTTSGILDDNCSNVVLVFHALTGNTNATEWWSGIIGSGKVIDTDQYFVICCNSLGSCYGSTGPQSINPEIEKPYGKDFPKITIRDIARTQLEVLKQLKINQIQIGIGGSMGAMVLLELALLEKQLFKSVISIACAPSHTAWRIAFSSIIRKTIEHFGALDINGSYEAGMKLARQIGMISYRSSAEFEERFARKTRDDKFEVEHYLEHQGEKIAGRFSPMSYLRLTEAMESYDLANGRSSDLSDVLSDLQSTILCIGIDSDILYPEQELRQFASSFPNAEYKTLSAVYGHDSFLVAQEELASLLAPFISRLVPIPNFQEAQQ